MNYAEAMAFLEETKSYGSQLGLDNIRNLMNELDNVQDKVPLVHIGGTNGKGSVGAMLSAVLVESGYRVGRFDTPDVFSYEEEFLLNGEPIQPERLAELFGEVKSACQRLVHRGLPHPTRFEVETAAAFLWFYEEKCDLALVEVGMGGATDATNVISHPLLSVLTSISRDHMQFLGDTLAEIAGMKAGIIKPACPVVTMDQPEEVMEVLRRHCEQKQARLHSLGDKEERLSRDAFGGEKGFPLVSDLSLGLRGSFQRENASCALTALRLLQEKYPRITANTITAGLQGCRWPGRFEQICQHPEVFLDGAHNIDAARKLKDTIQEEFAGRSVIYIMGVLADKEYEGMIDRMFVPGDLVFAVTPDNPRALPAEKLAGVLKAHGVEAFSCASATEAARAALDAAKALSEQNKSVEHVAEDIQLPGDETDNLDAVIVAFGSLFYLKSMREAFGRLVGEPE